MVDDLLFCVRSRYNTAGVSGVFGLTLRIGHGCLIPLYRTQVLQDESAALQCVSDDYFFGGVVRTVCFGFGVHSTLLTWSIRHLSPVSTGTEDDPRSDTTSAPAFRSLVVLARCTRVSLPPRTCYVLLQARLFSFRTNLPCILFFLSLVISKTSHHAYPVLREAVTEANASGPANIKRGGTWRNAIHLQYYNINTTTTVVEYSTTTL